MLQKLENNLTSRGNGYYSIRSKYNKQKGGKNVWTIVKGKLKTVLYKGASNQLHQLKLQLCPMLVNTVWNSD
jgi:hypothetical protein